MSMVQLPSLQSVPKVALVEIPEDPNLIALSMADWNQILKWMTSVNRYLQAVGAAEGDTLNKSLSFNFDFTSQGTAQPDPVPDSGAPWGSQISADSPITFVNVPAGQRVQLLRFTGSMSAMFTSQKGMPTAPPAGASAGYLCGLITQTKILPNGNIVANNQPSPDVDEASAAQSGCPMFLLSAISDENSADSIQFDLDLSQNVNAILDANNTVLAREAFYLNNGILNGSTNIYIHLEISGILEYQYVPAP